MKNTSVDVKQLIIDLLEHHGSYGLSPTAIIGGGGDGVDWKNNRSIKQHPSFRTRTNDSDTFSEADIKRAFDSLVEKGELVCNESEKKSGKKTYRLSKFPSPDAFDNELVAEIKRQSQEMQKRRHQEMQPENPLTLAEQIANAIQENELKTVRAISDAYRDSLLRK